MADRLRQAHKAEQIVPISDAVRVTNRHILIVDDEQSVRDLTSDMVSSLGCRVTTAADGEDALRI